MNPQNRYSLRRLAEPLVQPQARAVTRQLRSPPLNRETANLQNKRTSRSSTTATASSSSAAASSSSSSKPAATTTAIQTESVQSTSASSQTFEIQHTERIPLHTMATYIPTSLEKFSGDNNRDASHWILYFERHCDIHKYDNDRKFNEFPFYLTSHAQVWFDSVAARNPAITNYAELRAAFIARFRKHSSLDFLRISQHSDETVEDYFTRLLAKSTGSNVSEQVLVEVAIEGLKNSLKLIVMPRNPRNLEDARQAALLAEKTILATSVPVDAYQPANQLQSLQHRNEALERELNFYRHKLSQAQQPNQPYGQNQYRKPNYRQFNQRRQDRGSAQENRRCPHCQGRNLNCAYPKACPLDPNVKICFNCKKIGHTTKACYFNNK